MADDNGLGAYAASNPFGTASVPTGPVDAVTQEAKIRAWAKQFGMTSEATEKAVAVAKGEGLNAWSAKNPNAASSVDLNPDGTPFSFGDFQDNVRNGLGVDIRKAGLDPADPSQRDAVDQWNLRYMAQNGFGPWKGDKVLAALEGTAGQGATGQGAPTKLSGAVAPTQAGQTNTPEATTGTGNPKGLYAMMLLQALAPMHKFTPVDYDPRAVMPQGS